MIDLKQERLITLTEAVKLDFWPSRRGGRLSLGTIYRWAQVGVGGIRLEVVKIGSALCTSLPAIHRFIERLTAADTRLTPSESGPTVAARRREVESANQRVLAEVGA